MLAIFSTSKNRGAFCRFKKSIMNLYFDRENQQDRFSIVSVHLPSENAIILKGTSSNAMKLNFHEAIKKTALQIGNNYSKYRTKNGVDHDSMPLKMHKNVLCTEAINESKRSVLWK